MTMCPTVWFYLAEIYRLLDEHPSAKLSMVADAMDVSLQAASRMFRRMAADNLVVHEPYKGVALTAEGERIALCMLRRHRILEAYLVTVMAFDWAEVHDMVDSLEKGASDRIVDRMDEMAGFPKRCPHGEPIPSRDGVMPKVDDRPLYEWPQGTPAKVSRIKTHDAEKLHYLASVQLIPGQPLTITAHGPFDGPVASDLCRAAVRAGCSARPGCLCRGCLAQITSHVKVFLIIKALWFAIIMADLMALFTNMKVCDEKCGNYREYARYWVWSCCGILEARACCSDQRAQPGKRRSCRQ